MKVKKLLLFIPIITLIIYFCAGIFYNPVNVIYFKPLIIPSFMVYAMANNFKKLTVNYSLFVIFFYINEVLLLFWNDSLILYRITMITSFFCYLSLIYLGYKTIKNNNLYTFPKGFTLFILSLNCIFLAAILYVLISTIGDAYLNIILIFNAIAAVILGVTAVLYLGRFIDRKSYYYFFGAFALIFNDVFAAVVTYFIDNVLLNTMDRLFHFTSFVLIYLFIIKDKKKVENHLIEIQP
ncbi:hypothetical protein [Flavobacterium sp.]|uniref:hypothetical protein n=1 Tax=Flavobacterium sp. TaxID=239 RepID=UPI0037522718